MSTLDSRYGRMLGLLPSAYRERRAEEMLGMLLDGADEGQRWPRPAEVASVAGLAVRLRTGAAGGSDRAWAFGEVLQRLALAGLIVQALYYAIQVADNVVSYASAQGPGWSASATWMTVLVTGESVLPAAALVCLVRGRIRTGRILAVLSTVLVCVAAGVGWADAGVFGGFFLGEVLVWIVSSLLGTFVCTTAVLFGFHRDAPTAAAASGPWLKILAVSLPLVLGCTGAAQFLGDHGISWAQWVAIAAGLLVSPIVPAVAVLAGLSRTRRPVVWSSGLLLLSVPIVAVTVEMLILELDSLGLRQMDFTSTLLGGSVSDLACEAVVTQVILAAACWFTLRRRGRLTPANI